MIRVSLEKDAEIRNHIESIEEMYKNVGVVTSHDLFDLTKLVRALLMDIYMLQSDKTNYHGPKPPRNINYVPSDEYTNKPL